MKKLEKITDLEKKVKKGEIKANEEQLDKIAGKASVQAEIDEVNSYMTIYTQSTSNKAESESKLKK